MSKTSLMPRLLAALAALGLTLAALSTLVVDSDKPPPQSLAHILVVPSHGTPVGQTAG